jgi:hypothetical protein
MNTMGRAEARLAAEEEAEGEEEESAGEARDPLGSKNSPRGLFRRPTPTPPSANPGLLYVPAATVTTLGGEKARTTL